MTTQQMHLSAVSTSSSQGTTQTPSHATHTCYTLGIADPYQGSSWRYLRDEAPSDLRSYIKGGHGLSRGPDASAFPQRHSA